MVAVAIVVVDEGGDGGLELVRQEVVLEQDAVLQGLVPALDLALGLGVVRCTADVGDALAFEPTREITRDVGGPIVARPVDDLGGVAAGGRQGELERVGDVADGRRVASTRLVHRQRPWDGLS